MCVCARARVANTKLISPCSFFLLVAGGGGLGGVGGRPGRRLGGPAGDELGLGLGRGRRVAGSGSLFHIPGVLIGKKTSGERGLGVWGAGSGRTSPPRRDICPGSQPGGERTRCIGQAPRPGAAGARARGGRLPGYCAPADFHGRLPGSHRRRPGASLSPGFKRHSRNVNNPGGRPGGRERAGASGGPPTPPRGQPDCRPPSPIPLPAANFFLLCLPFLPRPSSGTPSEDLSRGDVQGRLAPGS